MESLSSPVRSDAPSRLKEIVGDVLELPQADRVAYLERACGEDDDLRREAAALLDLESEVDDFLSDSPMRQADSPLASGDRLGPYRILRSLGSGGMGDVYLAERADGTFEQEVAVKVIRRGGGLGELYQRFLSERQLLADLKHPNIANLLDGGTTGDGRPYLVMEYVDGQPIDAFCQAEGLSVGERLRLCQKVCAAVQYAHQHLVIHRDLKPANILVTAAGEPKLLDFGVAKDVGGAGKTPETRLLVPVTPEYASPEQLMGQGTTTGVDVYALGVVLYELLAGQGPFDGQDPLSGRSRSAPPERPSTRIRGFSTERRRLRRRLAGDLDHIVLRALEPDVGERYTTVEQLARDLERHLRGQALETREGTLYRFGKMARRHWKWLAAAALALALAGFWFDAALERRQLERENQRVVQVSEELGKYLEDLFKHADPTRGRERSEVLERMLDRGAELLAAERFAEPLMRARLLGAVGQVYWSQDRLNKAEPLLRESLALRRRHLPPDDEWIAVACSNLALTLRDLGSYPEARSLLWEARSILRQLYPEGHLKIAVLLNNLAGVEKDLGRFEQAVEHYREALLMKRRLGARASSIALAIKNLGVGLRSAGRLEEAGAAFGEALSELARLEKPNPAYQAGTEHHLGSLHRERGKPAAAAKLLESAYAVRVELYGVGHKKSAETLLELALLDREEGRLGAAEERLRTVVEIRRRRLGDDRPLTAAALVHLAHLLGERGTTSEAVALAKEALETLQDCLPAGDWRIAEAKELLAELRQSPRDDTPTASDLT